MSDEQQEHPVQVEQEEVYTDATRDRLPVSEEHRWGEPITPERQAELDGYLRRWDEEGRAGAGHGERQGPFAGETGEEEGELLTGADVYYLSARVLAGGLAASAAALATAQAGLHDEERPFAPDLSALHLERAV